MGARREKDEQTSNLKSRTMGQMSMIGYGQELSQGSSPQHLALST